MEILNPSDIQSQYGLKTLEKLSRPQSKGSSLIIGFPQEGSVDENRVCITPGGTSVLVANGHQVLIEAGAGEAAHFPDQEYAEAGAQVCPTAAEIFKNAEIISKVAPPTPAERELMRPGQILISAIHLGNVTIDLFNDLVNRNVTGIGFEFIQSSDGSFPIVRMMHEITGSMAVQIAARLLETSQDGPGLMLGGISGVPPATVTILGSGIIAEYAARTALGYGAQIFVLDTDLGSLRRLENALDRRIITAVANQQYLTAAVKSADVVIGAALTEGHRAPCWVTEAMVSSMKAGSVVVDTVIDQGGCVSTSKPTSHSRPVFIDHGVIHYCVPNIPSSVARTATFALNNVIVPYLLKIGDVGGLDTALWQSADLRNGTYIYRRTLTKKSLSMQFEIPYREIDMLLASRM